MSDYELILKAQNIAQYRASIDEESKAILTAANKLPRVVPDVIKEMFEGVNAKLASVLSESVYSVCNLPEYMDRAITVIGCEDDEIQIEYVDRDGDHYQLDLTGEMLVDETMHHRLRQEIAGMLVSYMNKEEPMAIESLNRERKQLETLKEDLKTVRTESTRKIIEENIKECKSVIQSRNLFLKDIDVIKQRILNS